MNNHTPIITLHPHPSRPVERIPTSARVAVNLGGENWLHGKITGCTFGVVHHYDVDLNLDGIKLIRVPAWRIKEL